MFRRLPPLPPLDEGILRELAERMREPALAPSWSGQPTPQELDNEQILAG